MAYRKLRSIVYWPETYIGGHRHGEAPGEAKKNTIGKLLQRDTVSTSF